MSKTPCQERGYQVGDVFEILGGSIFTRGSIVELYHDDESMCPLFKVLRGECSNANWKYAGGEPGAYITLDLVNRIYAMPQSFTPFSISVVDRHQGEILKSIMHLCNKVADSSYFNLDFTPDREDVRKYMREMREYLEERCPGYLKYNK